MKELEFREGDSTLEGSEMCSGALLDKTFRNWGPVWLTWGFLTWHRAITAWEGLG